MKRLGAILHIMDNLLIVRADSTLEHVFLRENLLVVTKRMKRLGKIKEIFGPVNTPFISIKLLNNVNASEIKGLKNERVYLQ